MAGNASVLQALPNITCGLSVTEMNFSNTFHVINISPATQRNERTASSVLPSTSQSKYLFLRILILAAFNKDVYIYTHFIYVFF
jgi:hypothetical protein